MHQRVQSAGETAWPHQQSSLHPHLHTYYHTLVSLLVCNVHTHQQDWLKGRGTQGTPSWRALCWVGYKRDVQGLAWPVGFTVSFGSRTHIHGSPEVNHFLCFPWTRRFRKSSVAHSPAILYCITHITAATDSLAGFLGSHWSVSEDTVSIMSIRAVTVGCTAVCSNQAQWPAYRPRPFMSDLLAV